MEAFVRRRWLFVGLLFLVVAAVTPGAMKAAVPDNALTVWFLETDPQLETYHEFQREFGNDEVILLNVETDDGVFRADRLRQLEALQAEIEKVDGVEQVHSVLTVQDAWERDDELVFEPLVPRPLPDDASALETAAKRAAANPMFRDRLVSADGKQAMLWIEMAVMGDIDAKRDKIVADVSAIADERLDETPHALGGLGVIYSGLNVITQHDFGLFISLGYLLMFLLMWWVFRSGRIVGAAIGVISVGTMVSIGVYGWLGHQLNMVTVVLPILVIVLGIADAVHMPAAFVGIARDEPEADRPSQLVAALRKVLLPTVLTTATTMGGFLALSSSPMAVIRHLGIFAALGIGVALVATFILMAVAFHGLSEKYQPPEHRLIESMLGHAERLVTTRQTVVIGVTLLIIALSAFGASRVEVDTYTIGYMPDDHRVVTDHQAIEARWGKYSILDFIVRPKDGRTMQDPEVVTAMEAFVEQSSGHELIRDGFSIADVYRRMAAVYGGDEYSEPGADPLTAEQIEQLSVLLGAEGMQWDPGAPGYRDNFLAPLMTKGGELGRVTLTGQMISAKTLEQLLKDLDGVAQRTAGGVATLEPAGYPPLYVQIIDYVMTSQIRGFFIALGVIFLMMLLGFRSLRLALVSLPPNVFPVLVMMGVMGALNIHLDVATATVGAIVIGISIDDTVHFLHHWRKAEQLGLGWEQRVSHTFGSAGVAATITTILLVGGFPILMLAGVKTVFYFGLLTTVSAAAALFGDLFILPLLLQVFAPRGESDGVA